MKRARRQQVRKPSSTRCTPTLPLCPFAPLPTTLTASLPHYLSTPAASCRLTASPLLCPSCIARALRSSQLYSHNRFACVVDGLRVQFWEQIDSDRDLIMSRCVSVHAPFLCMLLLCACSPRQLLYLALIVSLSLCSHYLCLSLSLGSHCLTWSHSHLPLAGRCVTAGCDGWV